MKKFKDLQEGDPIFFIQPETQEIKNIITSQVNEGMDEYKGKVLVKYKLLEEPIVDTEKENPLLKENNVKFKDSVKYFYLPKNDYFCLVATLPPTVYCTDYGYLKNWMEKSLKA